MPLKLTKAERRRMGQIRVRLGELEQGRALARPLFAKLAAKSPVLSDALDGFDGDQNNLRWLLAILDREDAR